MPSCAACSACRSRRRVRAAPSGPTLSARLFSGPAPGQPAQPAGEGGGEAGEEAGAHRLALGRGHLRLGPALQAGKAAVGGCLMVVGFEGDEPDVDCRDGYVSARLIELGGEFLGEEPGEAWRAGR